MRLILSQWPNKPVSIHLKSLQLSHILRRRVLRHRLKERMQQSIIILPSMHSLKANMSDARQSQHHCKHRVSPTVKASHWPKINMIVLEPRVDCPWESASVIQRNSDDILLTLDNSLGK